MPYAPNNHQLCHITKENKKSGTISKEHQKEAQMKQSVSGLSQGSAEATTLSQARRDAH